jgi:hypothetical protein
MGIKEREIKKILAGNVCFEGGMIVARESNWMVGTQGIPNGWGIMMVAGLYKREFWFDVTEKKQDAFEEAVKVLQCMGKRCKLNCIPGSEAIIRRNGLLNPQLLLLERDEYQLRLTIYTARTLTAPFACKRTIKIFQKYLPQGVAYLENQK